MSILNSYSLVDFGNSRRLERFGHFVIDRLCPAAADFLPGNPAIWKNVDFRFTEQQAENRISGSAVRGTWVPSVPPSWTVLFDSFKLELRGTPFGHLGVFPEQTANWERIQNQIRTGISGSRFRVLNLFAYTGGSSLAAAMGGTCSAAQLPVVEVVHVDSSKSVVEWAKQNAKWNNIENSIRFITEDARKFVKREFKRGNRYDAVILDPPTYGHGVKGESWKITADLPELLADLKNLLVEEPLFFLLTAHTPSFNSVHLQKMICEAELAKEKNIEKFSMSIPAETGKYLPAGCGVFFTKAERNVTPRSSGNFL